MAPWRTSSRARIHCGWWVTMNASAATRPVRSRSAISASISSARSAIGFSQSTCLPASRHFAVHSTCWWFGSGM